MFSAPFCSEMFSVTPICLIIPGRARGESCGPTKNAHLYRDMARVPDTRVQIQTCGDTCLDIIDIYAPGTIMSRAAGGNKIGFNYYSCPIKIYRPIVS